MSTKKLPIFFLLAGVLCSCSKKDQPADDASLSGKEYSLQSVGKSAHDLLADNKFTSLKIEIQYMAGYTPDASAISKLKSFLGNLLHKPGGITITQSQIPSAGKNALSTEDIASLEDKYRTAYSSGKEIDVYLLYADADFTDAHVLGVSYRNTSVCLFGKTIADNSGAIGQANRTQLTATVLEHEFGHLMGLVNVGTPMQTNHEDNAHPNHCNNKNCLMYYAAETTDILGFLIAGSVPALDANCINDLKANGGS
jgi:hypothetical protein